MTNDVIVDCETVAALRKMAYEFAFVRHSLPLGRFRRCVCSRWGCVFGKGQNETN